MGVMGQLGSATTKATKRRDNKAEYIIVNGVQQANTTTQETQRQDNSTTTAS